MWRRLDGTKPPDKKYFEQPVYNPQTREFTGTITWGENTFSGDHNWTYQMIFSEDLTFIESGHVIGRDIENQVSRQT